MPLALPSAQQLLAVPCADGRRENHRTVVELPNDVIAKIEPVAGQSILDVAAIERDRLADDGDVEVVGDRTALDETRCDVEGVNWVSGEAPEGTFRARVQIRHRHAAAPATLQARGDEVELTFDEPQRAITPGQAAVFYQDDEVIGGGWIR